MAQTRGLYGQLHELGASTPSVNIAGADGRLRVLADQTDDLVQAGLCKWTDGAPSAGTTPSAKEAEPPPPDGSAGGTTRGGRRMLKAAREARQSRSMAATRWSYGLTAFLSFLAPLALALVLGAATTSPAEVGQVNWLHAVEAPKRLETVTNGVPLQVHERRQAATEAPGATEAPASKTPGPAYHLKHVGVWAEWERNDYYGFHQAARPLDLTEIEEVVQRALGPFMARGGFASEDPADPNGFAPLTAQADGFSGTPGVQSTSKSAKASDRRGPTSTTGPSSAYAVMGQCGGSNRANAAEGQESATEKPSVAERVWKELKMDVNPLLAADAGLRREAEKMIGDVLDAFPEPDPILRPVLNRDGTELKVRVHTKDEVPITSRTYRVAPDRLPAMRDKLNEMMKQGVIRRSNSSWSSPLVFVPKPPAADGTPKWRCTVDMRRLNAKTVPYKYPTPHIDDLMQAVGTAAA